ncbi:aspartate/methionine/tyrosine aminotransferase [Bradyrhizobium sp. LM6.11]
MTKSSSLNNVFADLPVTIFEAMSQAARDNAAINLGQGFPDDPGPEDIRRAAADASLNGYNQYPSMMGLPELRQAIATHYDHWHGLKLDPMSEVMVTSGGTEALTSAILAVVQPAATRWCASSRCTIPICRSSARPAAFRAWSGSSRRIGG